MVNQDTEYQYDVFISVKSSFLFEKWIVERFMPIFEEFLCEDSLTVLGRRPKLFFFRDTLKPGDPWPEDLRNAIKKSCIAIALCTPTYFATRWCLVEFHSFLNRVVEQGARVLIPISIYDGESFPEYARSIQAMDISEFVIDGEAFEKTIQYVEFQKKMRVLSDIVAQRLKVAPAYQDWPIIDDVPEHVEQKIQLPQY